MQQQGDSLICTQCAATFIRPTGHRGRPSERCDQCRPTGAKLRTKTCPVCEVAFVGCGTRIYCSAQCRNRRQQQERQKRQVEALSKSDKHCTKCDRTQPVSEFRKDSKRLDGLYPWCRDCWRKYTGVKPLKPRTQSRAEYERERRRRIREQSDDYWFDSYLWTNYRMTTVEYELLLERQHYACAICGTKDAGRARGRANGRFSVDHDHSCCAGRGSCGQCVRGLLCRSCNFALGFFKDDARTMRAAIRYLDQPRPITVTPDTVGDQFALAI